jgi:hypothetical protein
MREESLARGNATRYNLQIDCICILWAILATGMRHIGRQLMTASLLAIYGSIALVGYGLHELSPAHSHGSVAGDIHSHSHAHCSHHHHHSHAPVPDRPGCSDAQDCDICVFLDQVRSDSLQLVAIDAWQPFVADVAAYGMLRISEPLLGLYDSRGPPVLIS